MTTQHNKDSKNKNISTPKKNTGGKEKNGIRLSINHLLYIPQLIKSTKPCGLLYFSY